MIHVLILIIISLLTIIGLQYIKYIRTTKEINYIINNINEIISSNAQKNIKIFTENKKTISMLLAVNKLLAYNNKLATDHAKMKKSMKRMLSNISHDLKTPLTVVSGYIDTLLKYENISAPEKKEYLLKVQEKANEIAALIDKFFDLAKIEAGDTLILLSKIAINEICEKNILQFYDMLCSKSIKADISIPDRSLYVLGNEDALNRILSNLISNSIHYGYEGNVIGLTLRYDHSYVYIDVWDKGKGIEEKNQSKIFDRIYTLDDSRDKYFKGSGLGLTIIKKLTEKMKGFIYLESIPYEKTVFTVQLKRIY